MKNKVLKFLTLIPALTTIPIATGCSESNPFPYVELDVPTCVITTENKKSVTSKTEYLDAIISIKNCDESQMLTNVTGKIRGRGNYSWTLPKKCYRIKFDSKTNVLGSLYKAKNWVLISNYMDGSLFRNFVAYKLSSYLNNMIFSPSVHMIDFYLNDSYLGMYLLTDKLEVSKERINIDDSIDPNANNGFLLELTSEARAIEDGGVEDIDFIKFNALETYQIKSPDTSDSAYLEVAQVQTSYIKNYLQTCKDALNGNEWDNITNLIDVNSFADGYIIEELFSNLDVGKYSMFYYKDKGGKLCHGPVWDFDFSAGNINDGPGTTESCPPDESLWAGLVNSFYKNLLKFDEFKTIVGEKIISLKQNFEYEMNLLDINNKQGYYLSYLNSIDRNFSKWGMFDSRKRRSWPKDVQQLKTASEQISFLKEWLEKRFAFLEKNYVKYYH